ncbi:uncharacterized protein LOC123544000 isoform X2 [Mercenaria mercenaria]|uniref:uncharacterized protein LOC123544000 isoform X2 n=1 Tax=Mercenaria mercenaria TaxID=6596 RepID=UPI00234F514F|nr:uncharacterized protein LOC123544000 isoform X2 [Mercenaria mercenaria]
MEGIAYVLVCLVPILIAFVLFCVCCVWCCQERQKRTVVYEPLDSVRTEENSGNIHRTEQSLETKTGINKQFNKEYGLVCEYCERDFRRKSALKDHQRDTYFAKCRFKKYKQVRQGDNARNFVKERCEQAALYMDNYHKCRDTVIEVLTKMLGHSSNGGRFCETPDREGSTKTGLKTRKAVEFDFSVEILLHENPDVIFGNESNYDIDDTSPDNIPPGSAQVRLKLRDIKRFKECCRYGDNGVLSPYELRKVFHRYIYSVQNTGGLSNYNFLGIYGVNVIVCKAINGPAVRLIVEHWDIPHKIDVDLTPKIVLPSMHEIHGLDWPRNDTYRFLMAYQMNTVKNQPLYLVPKKEKYWSVSSANYENAVLHIFPNTSTEKNILRCMKVRLEAWRTRSPIKMKPISSYILKEVFFWLRENLPEDNLWTPDKCADRYCNFLEELKFCFRYKHLFDYFFPATDLMKGKENSCTTMIKYLDQELEWIQANA